MKILRLLLNILLMDLWYLQNRLKGPKWLPFVAGPYLHESRHQHAMRRARGTGGRFAKKSEVEGSNNSRKDKDNSRPVSSGSEPLPSDSTETWNSPNVQHDARGTHDKYEVPKYENVSGSYHNHNGLQSSTYHLHSGERIDEGDCSGQQRGSMSSGHAAQRRLTIQ